MRRGKLVALLALGALFVVAVAGLARTYAADPPSNFNLQITPSPLVTTVKPGAKTQLELKIRNGGTGTEHLRIEPRSFTFNSETGQIDLDDTTPPDIASWISFSESQFSVASAQWVTERVIFDVPANAGFSYSFALVISRQEDPKPVEGGRLIKGSVAVFALVNVDRPGATSHLEVSNFSVSKRLYEYLPTTFSIRFHNSGNTITQPYGNIFIKRGKGSDQPLGTLLVNENKGYILPDTQRTINANWTDGFPSYQTVQKTDGTTEQKLVWDWTKVSSLRIGRYTAKLIAVYSQNGRDIPIEGTVSFWVIPWKILSVLLVILLLLLFALFMLVRSIIRSIKRQRTKRAAKKGASKDKTE